ncbi:MAG: hypothetical protein IJ092_03125 [Atopobiaceae bacterium]|nr:hypothetical protein [Atopobiaceae bacterium]
MQTIPASWVRAFSASLSQLSGRMRAMLEAELLEVDYSDVAEAREQVVEIMETYCGLSADAASEIAVEFYDGIREAHLGERLGAEPAVSRRPGGIEGAVRAFAQDLADGKPPERFRRKCLDRLDYETRLAANECVRANAERDPARPRYARVPSGNETCRFCIMLASRGFVYRSEGLAWHAHANCDCVIVPGFEGMTEVEGYDPEYYRDCYAHPENHPEIREALNARRRELYAESVKSERKSARKVAKAEEAERRRVAALSDEAKVVFGSKQFVDTFGNATASRTESAIDDAMKSEDGRRINAAKLLSRDIEDGFDIELTATGGSKYLTGTGNVKLDKDGASSVRTIAHELAHRRDELSALSYTVSKIGRDGPVELPRTTSTGSWSSMDFEHGNWTLASRFELNKSGVTPAWKALKKRLGVKSDDEAKAKLVQLRKKAGLSKNDAESLSDIVQAASDGKVSLGYGHDYRKDVDGNVIFDENGKPVPYWNDTTRAIETWADYSASLVTNGREARLIQELFPDECAIMDAMMEVMV